ncbi:branched-chain amino acid aminotransferase [Cyclobacterium xiamenense]|uniref:branched-chain-amino-acid transaminase n=1 Tax=Cyclobacterium xiamenense TaxID=1297121 RepID=A0A1H6ZL81_9BACT|nr:aminotransferase class IV [Cyclobacterium xiamenense]SEJ49575.1 branched-chain amino acid aminotransferase [Cyclobacterium xiamenense]
MKPFCFSTDQIIDSQQARVHPLDIGLIRGYAIFDFFRTVGRHPLFLEAYLNRFTESARKAGLALDYSPLELKEIIYELIEKNAHADGGIRIVLTGGLSPNHFLPAKGQLFIFCESLQLPAEEKYRNGVKLVSVDYVRPLAAIKTTNYTYPCWLSLDWKAQQAEDVVYHHEGRVSESSRSNIFMVKHGQLYTPNRDILWGITRNKVIELAGDVSFADFGLDELLQADEVFISSTTKRILPITQIDQVRIGTGKPGPVTRKLMADFLAMELEIAATAASR